MNAAFARIILRYVIGGMLGALSALGLFAPEVVTRITSDRDVEVVIAFLVPMIGSFVVEFWYRLAKRYGWPT